MEKTGVNVLIENNASSNIFGLYYYFLNGSDMKEFLKYANHPMLHACWDTGHANIEGHQYDDILALGDDLYALHINDNHGTSDEHILPFLGTMSIDEVMTALKEIGYNGNFTFETGATLINHNSWPHNRREFKAADILQDAPSFLYNEIEKILYLIGEHILTAYDCFEE